MRDDDLEDDMESASKLSAGGIALGDKKQSIASKPVFHYQSAPAQDKSYQQQPKIWKANAVSILFNKLFQR